MSAMAVGESGLASKPASPAAGPTQVRLRCRGTQLQMQGAEVGNFWELFCGSQGSGGSFSVSEMNMLFELEP